MSSVIEPLKNIFKRLFSRWADSADEQQTYVKIFFALITALICGLAGPAFRGSRGLIFGLLMYGLTLYVVVYLLEIDPKEIGGRQKLVTAGLPTFLLLWVLFWTLLYTFSLPVVIL